MAEADPPLDPELEVGAGVPVGGRRKRIRSGQRPCPGYCLVLNQRGEMEPWPWRFPFER